MSAQTASYNRKSPTIKRILREAAELAASPSPDYHAAPLESNLFEWHFTLRGPPSTPYENGIYHGRITLPATYPLRPPSFRFLTPSGRFEVNREICLSISDHHEDTWQPAWGVRTAVVALRGFMETDAGGQVGGITSSEEQRRRAADASRTWRCEGCGKSNEEVLEESRKAAEEAGTVEGGNEEVPEGMKFGFKNESGGESGSQTPVPSGAGGSGARSSGAATPVPVAEARAVQTPVQPTQVLPPHTHAHVQRRPQVQAQLQPRDPLPAVDTPWLDKLIWTLAALLAAAVMRRLLG